MHRLQAGLSQKELAQIIGNTTNPAVSRHERFQSLPDIRNAIGYALVFGVSIDDLFIGLQAALKPEIEQRINDLEEKWGNMKARGPHAPYTARKLGWIYTRRDRA